MNQRKTSRRYYLFEDLLWLTSEFAHLRKRRPMAELQLLAGLVWAREGGKGPPPVVRTRDVKDHSWYIPADHTILLARIHRNVGALLHEMAHALGPRDRYTHGPAFRKRCIRLFKTYGDWSGNVDFP